MSPYSVAGKQYVSILVGWGGAVSPMSHHLQLGWKFGAQPRRLLIFALDGTASLPATAPRDFEVHALDDPKLTIDVREAAAGLATYQDNCMYCHGRLLLSAGAPAPDLRESRIALDWNSFRSVVKDGALLPKRMPRFDNLTDAQLRAIYVYIRAGARAALAKTPAAPPPPG